VKTPVAFLIYNRPELTRRVFNEIRNAQPPVLLIVADGPSPKRTEDALHCTLTRSIVENVDWPCTVMRNYADFNMGCRERVSSGLDWVFSQVPEAIVLEDDCLPEPGFFRFCTEVLEHFRDDDRVMMVSGTNMLEEWKSETQSYHFSNYGGVWGWASWRRAWNYYDVDMKDWEKPEVKEKVKQVLGSEKQFKKRASCFDLTHDGKIDTWDFQWSFARLARGGLSVVPSVNLICNIGFGPDASHTTDPRSPVSALKLRPLRFPVRWRDSVTVDRDYDACFIAKVTAKPPICDRIGDVLKAALRMLRRRD